MVIFHQCLHGRLHGALRSMTAGETSRVAASNLAVLKITGCTILLAGFSGAGWVVPVLQGGNFRMTTSEVTITQDGAFFWYGGISANTMPLTKIWV